MHRAERSAGVVVFHREKNGAIRYLLLDYGRHWDYPKGHVEKNEDDQAAARGELKEETGLKASRFVEDFYHEMQYFFRSKDKALVHKTVVFFLAEVADTKVKLSHEHVGYEFLPYEQALKRLTYSSAKDLLKAAHARLNQL